MNIPKRVLLLGEYSGFHRNLKEGLLEHGVECIIASTSDGFKRIPGDIALYNTDNKKVSEKVYNHIIKPLKKNKDLYGYDVVQLAGPQLYLLRSVNYLALEKIMKHSEKSFVCLAGISFTLYKSYNDGILSYYTFDNYPEMCREYDTHSIKNRFYSRQESHLLSKANGIIPVMYEYAVGVRNRENCLKTIPLPINCRSIRYEPNRANGKIVLMHGIIDEKKKGSAYIVKALNYIKNKYPNDVEVIIDGKLPLDEYLKLLKKTNILIDQCKEHCYGMNALYAMSMGKVVLGGASNNSLKEYNVTECPVFHIMPDTNQIIEQLENIIEKRKMIEEWGFQSRQYVEKQHDHILIAEEYIKAWTECK